MELTSKRPLRLRDLGLSPHEVGYHEGLELLKTLSLLYVRPLSGIGRVLDSGNPWLAVILSAAVTWLQHFPWQALLLVAVIFVPAAVLTAAKLEGGISAGVALERDYMPALVCHLMAWSAALLPLLVLRWIAGELPFATALGIAVLVYFGALSACSIRAISGTSFPRSIVAVVIALGASIAAVWVFSLAGSFAYILASPWVLYYLYMRFGSEMRTVGGGLSSRQRMHQLLEASTVNERDADARYQLGLVYQQRRDFARAKQYFRAAIRIDSNEPDAHYRLGCILRAEGDIVAALEELETAAAIDDKHASSEVWREIAAACLELKEDQRARDILSIYTKRRPFDSEGLYLYGVALTRMGQVKEAREALESARDSARTAPAHRRRQVMKWERMAAKQLRELPK
jgi:tetratricopeptide (TPR) repeat protein